MPVVNSRYGFVFFSIPKVACTSIKQMIFHVENDRYFENFIRNGRTLNIHNVVWPTENFTEKFYERFSNFKKITVVRDPVERFVSAYYNRVVKFKELSPNVLKMRGAGFDIELCNPSLRTFIEHIDYYRKISGSIKHHTDPAMVFLGPDLSFYDKVYRIEEIKVFEKDFSEIVGKEVTIGNFNSTRSSAREIDESTRMLIRKYCHDEIIYLSEYY